MDCSDSQEKSNIVELFPINLWKGTYGKAYVNAITKGIRILNLLTFSPFLETNDGIVRNT
ncbi:hypothetical protein J2TS4_39860 [Paenibacillus sp. J2TS4]|nr:hypothetical protein J2TS4_39860 [Paenibacillus sp. J2TS4]